MPEPTWALVYLRRVDAATHLGGLPIPNGFRTMGMTRLEEAGFIQERVGKHYLLAAGRDELARLEAAVASDDEADLDHLEAEARQRGVP